MPLRVANTVEKNIISVPFPPKVIAATTSINVLPSIVGTRDELAGRYIQNVGANACYYAIGHECDATNFNGVLAGGGTADANGFCSGMQFDASNCAQGIWVYSVSGTTIAVTILKRNDLATHGGIIQSGPSGL